MAEKIPYTFAISAFFQQVKCVNVPQGYFTDWPAALESDEPYEGSEALVKCKQAFLVTKGSFELQIEGESTITIAAGEMSLPYRYRAAMKIVSAEDGSGYICVTPRDGQFWQRQSGFVANGNAIDIATPQTERSFVVVISGDLGGNVAGAEIDIQPGTTNFVAGADTRFIHFWK
jgi:hypothetical protein